MTTDPPAVTGQQLDDREVSALIAEYQTGNAWVMHYDSFKWSAGGFLIAGVFIFWGALFAVDSPTELFTPATLVVTAVMSTWLLYSNHYRQLFKLKLDRLQELEELLGLSDHLRFNPRPGRELHKARGPAGHHLDEVVFVVVALGGPLLAYSREGFTWTQLLPVLIVIAVLAAVRVNEHRLNEHLKIHGTAPFRRRAREQGDPG